MLSSADAMRPPVLRRRSYALTDVGKRRPHNEDAFLADDTLGLYVVADGVGGHAKGEVASAESVEQVRNFICANLAPLEHFLAGGEGDPAPRRIALRRLLESAVQSACYMVFGMAEQDPEGSGMSTTLSALLVAANHAVIAQVGDSRVYRLHGGRSTQITIDHTLLNHQLQQGLITLDEARTMRGRNVITRAVGHHDYVEVDTYAMDLAPGDRFLLCTDGLHGHLSAPELDALLFEASAEVAVRRGIELANERGGKDNITALVVGVYGSG
jgi:serine/threonine protein phosphatase PrpC